MYRVSGVNDFVLRFANVNGTGSASANSLFGKSIFRMGIPVSPKNIFPSNIQGLPTWYEVRVSEEGYLGRKSGVDLCVAINPQSLKQDIEELKSGGFLVYDSSKKLNPELERSDISFIGIPMMQISMDHYTDPRHQQLFKNIIYIGALVALLDVEIDVVKTLIEEQFSSKPKLVPPNFMALQLGYDYAKANFSCPLDIRVERRNLIGERVLLEGNEAAGLGAVYGGATVLTWYPITPSTSLAMAYDKYAQELLIDEKTGKKKFAVVQAEDELAAIGMVLGATWNGCRAFTSTSGAGISLMGEFIGLAYFAEIPAFIVNVQRGGPSTGMPTRTQQGDILICAYASHGDTKHILLMPSTPTECFEMTAMGLDLADRFQTPVFMMTDLDLGMNEHLCEPLNWDNNRKYDRGKVLNANDFENPDLNWGRYLDIDGDGIPYRTMPGTHPTKGSYFTRGSSHNEYARYTEDGASYVRKVDRLTKKHETAKKYVPGPEFYQESNQSEIALIFYGTTTYAALECMDLLKEAGVEIDCMRLLSFPFNDEVETFIKEHTVIFVAEQNKDGQMKSLLSIECKTDPNKFRSLLHYDGTPITAHQLFEQIVEFKSIRKLTTASI